MATTPAPKMPSVGALSLMGVGAPSPYADPRIDDMVGTLTRAFSDPEQQERDEQLAFAGGMQDTNGHGSFGESMMGGAKAQSAQRAKNKELMGTYMPTIMNTILAQQAAKQSQMMLQAMMGPGGGSWVQRVSDQFGIAPEAIQADLMTNEGKGIREMIFKNSTPEYVMQDGAMIDKNPYTNGTYAAGRQRQEPQGNPGSGPVIGLSQQPSQEAPPERQPGMATPGRMSPFTWTPGITQSASGNAMMRVPDPNAPGGIKVGAPQGGAESSKMYANIGEEVKADWDPQTIQRRGENPTLNTRGDIIREARASGKAGPVTPISIGQPPPVVPQVPPVTRPSPPVRANGLPLDDAGPPAGVPPTGSFALGSDGKVDVRRAMNDINAMTNPAQQQAAWQGLQDQIAAEDKAATTGGARAPAVAAPVSTGIGDAPPANDIGTLKAQLRAAEAARDPTRMALIKAKIDQLTTGAPKGGIELTSDAEKKRSEQAVETEQKNAGSNLQEMRKAQLAVQKYDEALAVLQGGKLPTHSGIGTIVDKVGSKFGIAPRGMDEDAELKVLGGWLVNNVPRMEGPQSNFDREGYMQMAGMVNNGELPVSVRVKSAQRAKQMIMDAAPKEFGVGFGVKSAMPSSLGALEQEMKRRQAAKGGT